MTYSEGIKSSLRCTSSVTNKKDRGGFSSNSRLKGHINTIRKKKKLIMVIQRVNFHLFIILCVCGGG